MSGIKLLLLFVLIYLYLICYKEKFKGGVNNCPECNLETHHRVRCLDSNGCTGCVPK